MFTACLVPLCVAAVPVRQSYDISELLGHAKVVAPSSMPASPESENAAAAEDRASLITAAVRAALPLPDREKAQVSVDHGHLWVTADPAGQAVVKRVLDVAADVLLKQVMIESRVVRLPDAAMDRLGGNLRARLAAARIAPDRPTELTDAEADELTTAVRHDSGVTQLTAPRLIGFDSQPMRIEMTGPSLALFMEARASLSTDGDHVSVFIDFAERNTPAATRPQPQRLSGLYTAKTGATVVITPPNTEPSTDGTHTLMLVRVRPPVHEPTPTTVPVPSP